MAKRINRYHFTIGNGYHDIRIPIIEAPNKKEAFNQAKSYRGVPTDKITLEAVIPFMEYRKGKWVEV